AALSTSSASSWAGTCRRAVRWSGFGSASGPRTAPTESKSTSPATGDSRRLTPLGWATRASTAPTGSRSPHSRWVITRGHQPRQASDSSRSAATRDPPPPTGERTLAAGRDHLREVGELVLAAGDESLRPDVVVHLVDGHDDVRPLVTGRQLDDGEELVRL